MHFNYEEPKATSQDKTRLCRLDRAFTGRETKQDNWLGARILGATKQNIKTVKEDQEREDSREGFCSDGKMEN